MKGNFGGTLRGLLAGAALAMSLCGSGLSARAQGLDEPFREPYLKALQGKVVGYLPVSMSFDLAQGWLAGLRRELEPLGVKIVVRDPNWSTNAGAQPLTNLVSEKPDVIVVHNPDVQAYAKLLQKAENIRNRRGANQHALQLSDHSLRRGRLGQHRPEGPFRCGRLLQG